MYTKHHNYYTDVFFFTSFALVQGQNQPKNLYFSVLFVRRGLGVIKLGGPIYAIGGLDDSSCFSDVERYDPASNSWNSVQAMRSARGGVAVAILNGLIYASK